MNRLQGRIGWAVVLILSACSFFVGGSLVIEEISDGFPENAVEPLIIFIVLIPTLLIGIFAFFWAKGRGKR